MDDLMQGCVREKNLREYIEDLGRTELTHDYERETKRILKLLEDRELETRRTVGRLEAQIEEKDIVISSLTDTIRALKNRVF